MTHGQRFDVLADASLGTASVSPTLFGLFYEDLNRACDGGLNANVIANHSFDGTYLDRRLHNELIAMTTKRRGRVARDPGRHWQVLKGSLEVLDVGGITPEARFGRLRIEDGRAVVRNGGYQPTGERGRAVIAATIGVDMVLSVWLRSHRFSGRVSARLVQPDGTIAGEVPFTLAEDARDGAWQQASFPIPVSRTGRVHFEIELEGEGHLDIDEVSLVPADHWGAGDPRWSQGVFRRDLIETLAALNPKFMRFPGGCVVEGMGGDNAYDWKRTVGPLHQRRADYNLWGLRVADGDYSQSNQIGYYEFFLLCEDLGMEPMPIVPAGISCQFRSRDCIRHNDPDFDHVRQDVLDLIDWATGDPADSPWAALRAEAGHPEPFPLKYLGIGNENYGTHYFENYAKIREAVRRRNPEIVPILSAGPFAQGKAFDATWEFARGQEGPLIVDEHFYKSPAWFLSHADRYDKIDREGAQVFVGEYAAKSVTAKTEPNTFESALAEAAFLTGVERNSDVIAMTSYAPLLNNVGSRLWPHNLIDFNPETVMPTVNYEVQRLFGNTIGETVVPVVSEPPQGVFVSSTATSDRQYVKIVNTTNSPAVADLVLPAVSDGEYVVTRLSAELGAANSLTFEGAGESALSPSDALVRVRDGRVRIEVVAQSIASLVATRAAPTT
ncbi:alpha-L-arabinofuranosidase C-terminal domain-containing protein [Microbacterium sp. A588]